MINNRYHFFVFSQVSVSLQPEEIVNTKSPEKKNTKSAANKETQIRPMTVARFHDFTLGLTHSQLILPIPLHITPAFEADEGKSIIKLL